MIKCVLFDMNGVLINSENLNKKVWKHLFEIYGFDFNEEIYNVEIDGKTSFEIADNKIIPSRREEFILTKDRLWKDFFKNNGIPVFYDTVHCVDKLYKKGLKLGVVTSSRKGEDILKATGLYDYFDAVVTGNDVRVGKPDPEIILKAIDILQISTGQVAIVEDSIAGIIAGKRAGLYCIGLQRNSSIKQLPCDRIINSLAELEDIIG